MRTVIVLGAGSSVCEAQARRPKREKDRPPLDMDFFRRAKTADREPSLVRRIEAFATEFGHTSPFDSDPPTSLERFLGLLYFGLIQSPAPDELAAYFNLLRLYNRELSATTNWLVGRKNGPLEKLFRLELARKPTKLSVVTFNHDLLVEGALSSLPHRKFGCQWCIQSMPVSYEFDHDDVELIHTTGLELWHDCGSTHSEQVRLLKLHGSLNWVFKTRDLNPSINLAKQTKEIFMLPVKRPRADYRWRSAGARRYFYLWPVVVPPVYEKQGFIHQHLKKIWDRAERDLRKADRVIFFGYSFPSADYHARFFFERLAARNDALRSPIVINPDFRVAQVCWEVLKADGVIMYRSFDEYVRKEEEALVKADESARTG